VDFNQTTVKKMGFSDKISEFFGIDLSYEAGVARGQAVDKWTQDNIIYYIPRELRPWGQVIDAMMPKTPTEMALVPVGGALASKALGLVSKGAQKFSNAFLSGRATAADDIVESTTGRAVIRPDEVFRGQGTPKTSLAVATKPYAVRLTGMDQVDDMIASGLVRPKAGGYGQKGYSTIYFGEADTVGPTLFTRLSESKGARLVADSSKIAGREGPIPIDDLKHVFVLRNGEEVDILEEILRRNMEWKP
jgi:hypothetical protein